MRYARSLGFVAKKLQHSTGRLGDEDRRLDRVAYEWPVSEALRHSIIPNARDPSDPARPTAAGHGDGFRPNL
jgi:hypothetical protein